VKCEGRGRREDARTRFALVPSCVSVKSSQLRPDDSSTSRVLIGNFLESTKGKVS
jgi:hypothetical protein